LRRAVRLVVRGVAEGAVAGTSVGVLVALGALVHELGTEDWFSGLAAPLAVLAAGYGVLFGLPMGAGVGLMAAVALLVARWRTPRLRGGRAGWVVAGTLVLVAVGLRLVGDAGVLTAAALLAAPLVGWRVRSALDRVAGPDRSGAT